MRKSIELMSESTNYSNVYLIKRIYKYIRPFLVRTIIAMVITIPIGGLDALIAYILRPYMDEVLLKKSINAAWYVPIAIIVFTGIQGILTYVSTYLNGWLGQRITNNVKCELYSKLLRLETSYFDKSTSGYILTRFNADPDIAFNNLLNSLKGFLTRFFSSVSFIAVLVYNSWQLAIIAVTVLLCTLLPLSKVSKRIKKISAGMVISGSSLLSHFNETFAGNRVIASYNLTDFQKEKFNKSLNDLFRLNMKATQLGGTVGPLMHFIASFGIAAVVGYGSHLVVTNQMTVGALISFMLALILLYNPVKGIGGAAVATQNSFVAIGRILELIDYEPKIKNAENPVKLECIKNGIKFGNVSFEYNEGKRVLNNINLDVKLGETIALVGNSGGGKSTLVTLIPRFYDVIDGRIEIDGIDIRDYDIDSLREKISIVFQDNFLFESTIRENIRLGKLDATEEEIQKAVKDAYLEDFVASLEDGLDTRIGERGILLSGGQKQRVAIARALLKDAPIVILDEATSALDNKSEAIVQKAIDRLMENKTVFVIAHRLSTVHNATKIAVLDNGHIVELGNHEELMQVENGVYKALYSSQFKNNSRISESETEIAV